MRLLLPSLSALCLALSASGALAVPMLFDTPVEEPDGSSGGKPVIASTLVHFLDVATDQGKTVDVRVSATIKDDTEFATLISGADSGYLPDHLSGGGAGDPEHDLATRFVGENINDTENGITLTFSFFDGTGVKSGSFLDEIRISELEFAIYDIDGESTQSEFLRAYIEDGLASYQVGDTPEAVTASLESPGVYRFDGAGKNKPESDPSGALILTYRNVSSLTLDLGAVQSGGDQRNGVITGFDGDLSLFDEGDFERPVATAVPLPASLALLCAGIGGLSLMRRRSR